MDTSHGQVRKRRAVQPCSLDTSTGGAASSAHDHRNLRPRADLAHPWSHSAGGAAGAAAGEPASEDLLADRTSRPDEGRPGGASSGDERAGDLAAADLQVIVSVCSGRQGRVGLAFVDLEEPERVIQVTEVLDPELAQLGRLKQSLLGGGRRGLCTLPARSPPELLERAAEPVGIRRGRGGEDSEAGEPFPVAVLKATDFEYEPCRQRLLQLRVGGEDPSELPAAQRELRTRAVLDLSNEQLVCAAGGLARFMEKNRTHLGDLDEAGQAMHVHSIRLFSLDSMLFVDAQTMSALQVFQGSQAERRSSGFRNRRASGKDSLSLFGLLEPFVASSIGKQTLRRWLQQPSRDVQLLRGRHDAVEELMRPRHAELLRELYRELREVRDIAAVLRRIFGCYHFDNPQDWSALAVTLEHMSSAFELVRSDAPKAARALLGNGGGLMADIATAEDMVHHFINLDALASGQGNAEVRVRSGVDEQLDAVREQYDTIDSYLSEVAQLERQQLMQQGVDHRLADSVAFHYFTQLGFHVSLPNPLAQAGADEDASAMEELKRDANAPSAHWKYQFAGGGRLFYKCPLAERLDREIGDLVVAARDLELELLIGVADRLRRLEPSLCRAAKVLADLDVLLGFAAAATQFGWRRPQFSKYPGRLRICKGRHPLVEAALRTHHGFIPNSTDLGSKPPNHLENDRACSAGIKDGEALRCGQEVAPRVQVVTGANLAGKSVYLKQVGLIVLLAQVGSFVPAKEAELGLCDFLFSRIQSCEGAAVRCSSFGIDLAQVAHALRHATPASLLLLDEFGKGTHAADGVAIFGATVEHLCRCAAGPKAILTSHFTELFRFDLIPANEPGLQLCSMRVLPPGKGEDGIAYLYQLAPGVAEQSFGIECAKKAGLDEDTLGRAAEILAALERGQPVPAPKTGTCGDAAALAAARAARVGLVSRQVVERLCGTDLGDEEAVRELLAFVAEQQHVLHEASGEGP